MNKQFWKSAILIAILISLPLSSVLAEPSLASQAIPYKEDKGPMAGSGVVVFILVALLIALAVFFVYLKKLNVIQLSMSQHSDTIKILGAKRLGMKTVVYLLDIEGSRIVISQNNDKSTIFQLDRKQ